MDTRRQAQETLADFARSIELEELALDENDSCRLGFDDGLLVDIDFDPAKHRLVLSAGLGSPVGVTEPDIFRAALRSNALWQTMDAIVGLDGPTGEFVLLQPLAATEFDGQCFPAALERFVQAARGWRLLIGQAGSAGAATLARPDFDSFGIRV